MSEKYGCPSVRHRLEELSTALARQYRVRPGQVIARAQLLDLAREGNASLDVTDRAIDSHIKNLRKKLDAVLPGVDVIHPIYGLGYRFDL